MKSFLSFFFVALTTINFSLSAHDSTLGTLTGEHLLLNWSDHALSGHVGNTLVYAVPSEGEFKLYHRTEGRNLSGALSSTNDGLSGKINSLDDKGKAKTTEVLITGAAKDSLMGTLDGDAFTLKVSSQTKNGGHYVDPSFEVTVSGKTYSFKMKDGQACLGCIGKISFVVLGMLRSIGEI